MDGKKPDKKLLKDLLEKLGLSDRVGHLPNQLSGGQQQRVSIGRALMNHPALLLADEPTGNLDSENSKEIISLLRKFNKENRQTVIIITHDLGVIAEVCDSVSVMYAGKVVETGSVLEIFDQPAHPYTQVLLESNPKESDSGEYMKTISGAPPLLYETFKGCPFAPRCQQASKKCTESLPETIELTKGHTVACHNYLKVYKKVKEVS